MVSRLNFYDWQRGSALGSSARGCCRRLGGFGRRRWLQRRVKPAGMYPPVKCLLGLGVDISLPDEATEGGLDVGAWAAETIVKVEMAEGRVEIVAPEQGDNATAQPDAFRVARGTGQEPGRLGDFVDLFLAFLGSVSSWLLRFGRLAVSATLREGERTIETKRRHAEKHGKGLTQLESEPHCPRRMFDLAVRPSLNPVWGPIGTLIRR